MNHHVARCQPGRFRDPLPATCSIASAVQDSQTDSKPMDMLHVATALPLGATDFLTLDQNLAKPAVAEGLTAEP